MIFNKTIASIIKALSFNKKKSMRVVAVTLDKPRSYVSRFITHLYQHGFLDRTNDYPHRYYLTRKGELLNEIIEEYNQDESS